MGKKVLDNLVVNEDENFVQVSINPKFYNLDVIYSAIYVFLDKYYVKIEGEPEEEVIVKLKPKEGKVDLEKVGREFNNELISYAAAAIRGWKTADLRKTIIERALKSQGEGV
ncbi:MAG: His-Xaa-Ser system protein HxsD [Candidatus Aenigmatarchaeota archaeon]